MQLSHFVTRNIGFEIYSALLGLSVLLEKGKNTPVLMG
jgi:hypothetical protein